MGADPIFTIDFDFVAHQLVIDTAVGERVSFPLGGQSVASFFERTMAALGSLGVQVSLDNPNPFDHPDKERPFAADAEHATYDAAWATRYWQVLSQVNLVLEDFAAQFAGKISPVHRFWHTFDIASHGSPTDPVDQPADADPVTARRTRAR